MKSECNCETTSSLNLILVSDWNLKEYSYACMPVHSAFITFILEIFNSPRLLEQKIYFPNSSPFPGFRKYYRAAQRNELISFWPPFENIDRFLAIDPRLPKANNLKKKPLAWHWTCTRVQQHPKYCNKNTTTTFVFPFWLAGANPVSWNRKQNQDPSTPNSYFQNY